MNAPPAQPTGVLGLGKTNQPDYSDPNEDEDYRKYNDDDNASIKPLVDEPIEPKDESPSKWDMWNKAVVPTLATGSMVASATGAIENNDNAHINNQTASENSGTASENRGTANTNGSTANVNGTTANTNGNTANTNNNTANTNAQKSDPTSDGGAGGTDGGGGS
jgi:hypothetical protein